MTVIQKLIRAFDRWQRRHGSVSFPLAVVKKYGDDQAGYQAALLAYYAFLSLFPLLLVLTTLLKLFLRGDGDMQRKIISGATNYIPVVGAELSQKVQGLNKAGLALAVGILLTLYGARGVADVFRNATNHVWQVPRNKRSGFPHGLLKSFAIIVVGGLGLLAAPVISGAALNFGHTVFFRAVALTATAIILFAVFQFLARTASSVPRSLADVWVGSALVTVGLMLLQALGNFILAHQLKNLNNVYSTFAIVLGLMYWIFLQAQIILYALEVDSVRGLRLWPRSLQGDLTAEDRTAYRLYAHRNRFHDEEDIDVTTKKRPLLERLSGHDHKAD